MIWRLTSSIHLSLSSYELQSFFLLFSLPFVLALSCFSVSPFSQLEVGTIEMLDVLMRLVGPVFYSRARYKLIFPGEMFLLFLGLFGIICVMPSSCSTKCPSVPRAGGVEPYWIKQLVSVGVFTLALVPPAVKNKSSCMVSFLMKFSAWYKPVLLAGRFLCYLPVILISLCMCELFTRFLKLFY
jgi:hypothetical protein